MKRLAQLLCVAGAVAALARLGSAADRRPNPGSDPMGPKEKLELLFSEIDKNKDGSISLAEFKSAPLLREASRSDVGTLFQTVDTNIDGSLDKQELAKGFEKIRTVLQNSRAIMDDGDSRSSRRQLRRLFNR
jgi:EF hand